MGKPSVLVIGGGAAGLPAAIAAARLGADVTILESGPRVGRKVLASGNGRCNLSNVAAAPWAFNRPDFVEPVLERFTCDAVRAFFGDLGLLTYADAEGRVYPVTNAANSVLDVLRLECAHLGVEERCGWEVERISPVPDGFQVVSHSGGSPRADAVVVATGGGDSLLAALGHPTVRLTPVLAPLKTDAAPIRGLSGIRLKCAASLLARDGERLTTERGELLFRDYGVSGIMVFDLSRFLTDGATLSIDLFPDLSAEEIASLLSERRERHGWRSAETFFAGILQARVAAAILRAADVDARTSAAELPLERLAARLKDFRLPVRGVAEPKQAQVTRGGAALEGFDAETMASRLVEGIYAAGEVLDIDGRSGGFNLHWAWASGIVAGESAARHAAGLEAHS